MRLALVIALLAAGVFAPSAHAYQPLTHWWLAQGSGFNDKVTGPEAVNGTATNAFDPYTESDGTGIFSGYGALQLGQRAGNFALGDFTITVDVRPDIATGPIVTKRACGSGPGFELWLVDGHPELRLHGPSGTTSDGVVLADPGLSFPVGEWHHLGVTRHGSQIRLWRDGQPGLGAGGAMIDLDNAGTLLAGGNCAGSYYTGFLRNLRFAGYADGAAPFLMIATSFGTAYSPGRFHQGYITNYDLACADDAYYEGHVASGLATGCAVLDNGVARTSGQRLRTDELGHHAVTLTGADYLGNATTVPWSYSVYAPVRAVQSSYDFGQVPAGTAHSFDVVFTNPDSQTATVSGARVAEPFTADVSDCPQIAPGGTCVVHVRLDAGAEPGLYEDFKLRLRSSHPGVVNLADSFSSASFTVEVLLGMPATHGSEEFGDVAVGSKSAPAPVVVTNVGNTASTVSNVRITEGASDYEVVGHDCGTLEPEATCTIQVVFGPTASGRRLGTLVYDVDGATGMATFLRGTGHRGILTAAPGTVERTALVGAVSPDADVVLKNTSTVATLGGISPAFTGTGAGAFAFGPGTCAATLAPGASCTLKVRFAPTAAGDHDAVLAIASDGGTEHVTLHGLATQPVATVAPAALSFGSVQVGVQAPARSVAVQNTGNAPLHVGAVTIGGPAAANFSVDASGCAGAVAPAAACTLSVRFTPSAAGARTATLQIASDGGPREVTLSGTGSPDAPHASVDRGLIDFGGVPSGERSEELTVTLSNPGTGADLHPAVTLSGPGAAAFQLDAAGCAAALPAGGACVMRVRFAPTAPGSREAALTIASDAAEGPLEVALRGRGTRGALTLDTATLAFGPRDVGAQGPAREVRVTNTGDAPITLGQPAVDGAPDFTAAGCSAPLAAGASCSVKVRFVPAATGDRTATLHLPTNLPGVAPAVALSGVGRTPVPAPQAPAPDVITLTPAAPPAPPPLVVTAPPEAVVLAVLPQAKKCLSKRRLRVPLKLPQGVTAESVTIRLNGKVVKRLGEGALSAPVDMRGLPRGRFTVKLEVKTDSGKLLTQTRRYVTCVKKRG